MPLNLDEFIAELTAGREKNKELSPYIRVAICTLVASGRSEKSVARQFRVSDATVRHTIKHWKAHKNFDSSKRSGRPRKDAVARRQGGGGDADADAEGDQPQEDGEGEGEGDTTMMTIHENTTLGEMASMGAETSTPNSEAAREASIQNIMNPQF